MFHYVSEVVSEVLIGIAFWAVIGVIVILGMFGFTGGILPGFLIGSVFAALYFIHLSLNAETAVDMMDEKRAKNHTIVQYFLRLLVGAVIVFLSWKSGRINMLSLLAGFFTLKFGVYSRIVVHKIFQHFGKHLDVVSEEALEGARRWEEEEAAPRAARKAAREQENCSSADQNNI